MPFLSAALQPHLLPCHALLWLDPQPCLKCHPLTYAASAPSHSHSSPAPRMLPFLPRLFLWRPSVLRVPSPTQISWGAFSRPNLGGDIPVSSPLMQGS